MKIRLLWPCDGEVTMTVGDICNRNVVVAPKSEMIVDAAKRMRTSHVGDLVVVENRNGRHMPVGIVTDRDIVIAAVAGDPEHIECLMVGEVMTPDLVTAVEQDSIEAALRKMQEHGIRRLPIVDGTGALVGILTLDDILRYLTAQQSELVALVAREQKHERQFRI
jgi:CBS domain-containing protein